MRKIVIPAYMAAGYEFPSDIEVTICEDLADASLEVLSEADFVVLPDVDSELSNGDAISRMHSVKVVQTLTAGFDSVLPHIKEGVTLCNLGGVHDVATSELAVTLTLAALRELPRAVHAQANHAWERFYATGLADKRVLIVGYGEVGKAVEKRLLGFDCHITRVASTARGDIHGIAEVKSLLPEADVVMLTMPLNDSSRGLVDADFLSTMKDGALLVNVARGRVVVTDALIAELKSGRISAAIDVTDPEPLPSDHELWTAPNLLITPHIGGDSDAFEPRARKRIQSQLDLWLAGKPLECVIR